MNTEYKFRSRAHGYPCALRNLERGQYQIHQRPGDCLVRFFPAAIGLASEPIGKFATLEQVDAAIESHHVTQAVAP